MAVAVCARPALTVGGLAARVRARCMGKNKNKPVHKAAAGGGGGAGGDDFGLSEQTRPFHSKEFEQQHLNDLINYKERISWDEFKEEQRKKGLMEGAEARAEEEAQRAFRKELDDARDARLAAAAASKGDGKGDERRKHKKSKHKHHKEKKEKHKHKKRRRHSSSSSSSSSESEDRSHKKRKKEHRSEKKERKRDKKLATNADGAVSLRSFFAAGSDSSDSD